MFYRLLILRAFKFDKFSRINSEFNVVVSNKLQSESKNTMKSTVQSQIDTNETDSFAAELFTFLDQTRSSSSLDAYDFLTKWIELGDTSLDKANRLKVWLESPATRNTHIRTGVHFSPPSMAAFMAKLGAVDECDSVLDPACGTGLLLQSAAVTTKAKVIEGVELIQQFAELSRLVLPDYATVIQGDSLGAVPLSLPAYDLIVCEPPFGYKLAKPWTSENSEGSISDFANALLCKSVALLSERGKCVFLLPASCISLIGKKLFEKLGKQGFFLRALIHVPAGSLLSVGIHSYIVVMDRTDRPDTFVAQYNTDIGYQTCLISNFKNHRQKGPHAHGALVKFDSFTGFPAFEATIQISGVAKKSGLQPVPLLEFCRIIDKHQSDEACESLSEEIVYISPTNTIKASMASTDVNGRDQVQLAINTEKVDVRYFVSSLNSSLGKLFIDSVCTQANLNRKIDVVRLSRADYYLPSLEVQRSVVSAQANINSLRSELDSLETKLWQVPNEVSGISKQIKKVNTEDTLEAWIDTLPFPLATILWRYCAHNHDGRERNEILIHFYEAVAEFWATIFLSAAKSDERFWDDHIAGLWSVLEKQNLSFDLATFGLWKVVVEYLRTRLNKQLSDDPDRVARMFATSSDEVLSMLLNQRIPTILQSANSIRNGKAHGGASGPNGLSVAHTELLDLLSEFRRVTGESWMQYQLIQPGNCRYKSGMYQYDVRVIMGTRSPFVTERRDTISAMEDTQLHLLDPQSQQSLALLPFVRVMPSPKTASNACYFYNKVDSDNQIFVSYHFEEDSSVNDHFADVHQTLAILRPVNIV